MRAGIKNRRIEIQKLTTSKDTFGALTETWAMYARCNAQVNYINMRKGGEAFVAMMIQSEQWVIFKTDFIPGISPKTFRILWEGKYYDVRSTAEGGFKEYMELTCRATGL